MSELPPTPAPDAARGRGLRGVRIAGLALLGLGAVLCLLALLDPDSRTRFGFGYMVAFVFAWSIVIGSLFFVALQHATSSIWSVVLRRGAEALSSPMWALAVLFVPLFLVGVADPSSAIFPWRHPSQAMVHATHAKGAYLDPNGFLVRTILFFAIWIFFSFFFVRGSLRQDDGSAPQTTATLKRFSPLFLILFAFTVTFASFDWLMSLEPRWYSTIYGVYVFSGVTLTGLAAITLVVVGLKRRGLIAPELVRPDHLYSLGGLLFAFTCFWGYIAFSQFMLIWYGGLPEESIYYVRRMQGGWLAVSWAVVFARFFIPFGFLLSRRAKMDARKLTQISIFILLGQLLDLYWLVMPNLHGDGPSLGWQEFAPILLFVGVLLFFVGRFLRRHPLVARGDPAFEASTRFHLH
jgi:hypothetical protein